MSPLQVRAENVRGMPPNEMFFTLAAATSLTITTNWRRTQSGANPSPPKFPANREKYRVFGLKSGLVPVPRECILLILRKLRHCAPPKVGDKTGNCCGPYQGTLFPDKLSCLPVRPPNERAETLPNFARKGPLVPSKSERYLPMLPATYTSVVIEKAPETGNYLRQSVLQFPRRPLGSPLHCSWWKR